MPINDTHLGGFSFVAYNKGNTQAGSLLADQLQKIKAAPKYCFYL